MNSVVRKLYDNHRYNNNRLVTQPYISNDDITSVYEKNKLYDLDTIKKEFDCIDYKDLNKIKGQGALLANFYDEQKRLKQVLLPKTHKIIVGTTGSGKTQSYILPYIKTISSFKCPHSMVVSDLKGELYSLTANDLKEKGYNVICMNFKNALYSEMWNPLSVIYDLAIKKKNLKDSVKKEESIPSALSEELVGFDNIDVCQEWYLFNDKGYKSEELVSFAVKEVEEQINMRISRMISKITYSIVKTESADPYWDNAAREALEATIYRFLEFIDEGIITKDQFNFKNIIDVVTIYNESEFDYFFRGTSENSIARRLAKKIIDLASTTKSCVLSSLSTKMAQYKSYNIQRTTIGNTVDFSSFDEKPVVLYIIMDDMDKASYELIKLMLTFLYDELDNIASNNEERKLNRPFEFILDEFCNIPPLDNFANMISTSRSKDIWFTMVIQSYSQLEMKYGKEVKEIVMNNTNMEVFFGTNDYETKNLFSKKCGKNTRLSTASYYNGQGESISNYQKEEYNIVPVSDLNMIKEDMCFIRYLNYPIFKTKLTRFHKIKEFQSKLSSIKELYKPILLGSEVYSFDYFQYIEAKRMKRREEELNSILNNSSFESLFDD